MKGSHLYGHKITAINASIPLMGITCKKLVKICCMKISYSNLLLPGGKHFCACNSPLSIPLFRGQAFLCVQQLPPPLFRGQAFLCMQQPPPPLFRGQASILFSVFSPYGIDSTVHDIMSAFTGCHFIVCINKSTRPWSFHGYVLVLIIIHTVKHEYAAT